jgi:hypothetical protein
MGPEKAVARRVRPLASMSAKRRLAGNHHMGNLELARHFGDVQTSGATERQ